MGSNVGELDWVELVADHPMAELVLHLNREAIHHMSEIALLCDLWRAGLGRC